MKNLLLILSSLTLLFITNYSYAQDSLLRIDLSKHVYHFDVKDGKLIGDGAELLIKEAQESQYFLIGEFHGSPRISNFTNAMIPVLAEAGYEYFGLEVGPESVKILDELSKDPTATTSKLKAFNQKYNTVEEDGYENPAIPFFENVEDAVFLAEAKKQKLNLIGLDQEYYHCFIPLVDKMYDNLNLRDQKAMNQQWLEVRDSIKHFYKMDEHDERDLFISLRNSKTFKSYLNQTTKASNKNQSIADAMLKTIEIYSYRITRQYLKCNSTRIDHMKENLKKQFDALGFDLQHDKMVLKMGSVHTARGFSWLSLFELGNTLNELANFHGNKSINLNFLMRFYMEDYKEKDTMDHTKGYHFQYREFIQFGKRDQWTVIDLRPLKYKAFYSRQYELSEITKEVFKKHDLIIIPKIEIDATPNY